MKTKILATALIALASTSFAGGHGMEPGVKAADQSVAG